MEEKGSRVYRDQRIVSLFKFPVFTFQDLKSLYSYYYQERWLYNKTTTNHIKISEVKYVSLKNLLYFWLPMKRYWKVAELPTETFIKSVRFAELVKHWTKVTKGGIRSSTTVCKLPLYFNIYRATYAAIPCDTKTTNKYVLGRIAFHFCILTSEFGYISCIKWCIFLELSSLYRSFV